MATANDFITDIINYGGDEVEDIGENGEAFLIWLNNALVNRHDTVCTLTNKWTTDNFTMTAGTFEQAVPTDWDGYSTMILYTDSNHQNEYDNWDVEFGVQRFYTQQAATTYYRRYRQMPTVYTALTDTVTEIDNPRLKKVLMDEIIAMYLAADDDLESANAEQSELNRANRNG